MGKKTILASAISSIISGLILLFIGIMKLFVNENIWNTESICTWFFFIAAIALFALASEEYGRYKKE